MHNKKLPSIKIYVIVRPLIKERNFKLDYENLVITYFPLDIVQSFIGSKSNSELVSKLHKSVLLYDKDVLKIDFNEEYESNESLGNLKDAYQQYKEISNLFPDKI